MRPTASQVALGLLVLALAAAPALGAEGEAKPEAGEVAGDPGLMSRIDFGNAYVMGQSVKSGAVYLLNRKKSEIPSMLRKRKDFRREMQEDAETVGGD